jgi:hypothetical protein
MASNDTPRAGANGDARPDVIIAQAQRLLALGYPPVPVLGPDAPAEIVVNGKLRRQTPGKQPLGGLWHDKERSVYGATAASIADWSRLHGIEDCTNLGIGCGVIVCNDIDVYEPALAEQVERLAVATLGETRLRRYGQRPKRALEIARIIRGQDAMKAAARAEREANETRSQESARAQLAAEAAPPPARPGQAPAPPEPESMSRRGRRLSLREDAG